MSSKKASATLKLGVGKLFCSLILEQKFYCQPLEILKKNLKGNSGKQGGKLSIEREQIK